MSQRLEPVFDYKDRALGESFILADGGIAFDFFSSIYLLNRESTDRLLKLLLADRIERGVYKPHIGNFSGDL